MEPCLTATSVIRSPCYYGHFFGAIQQNGHTFSCKPVDMAKFLGLLVTVLMGFHCRGRGLGEGKKGGGFSLSLSPTPPPPSHRNRNHTIKKKIFELWAGDELVTCTEDQEICAISGRNGIVWQIINHVISHSLFLCTYYLIEVPAKYSC